VYQAVATSRDLAATPPPGRLVNIGGHRLHIWCIGSGSPTVILESGLGGSAFNWATVQPRVAEFTQVCSYDRAGFGYSDEGPAPRTSGRIADELAHLLDSARIDGPVILVAASFGGFSARILASTYPSRVAGLVLVDASHEDQQRRLAAEGHLPSVPPTLGFVVRVARFGFLRLRNQTLGANPEGADPSVRQFVRATVHRASRYRALYSETMAWEQSAEQVRVSRRRLDIPLLVMTAGSWPENGRQIHTELQGDQVILSSRGCQQVAEHAGHDIVGDAPNLVVQAVRAVTEVARAGGDSLVC
jgi:pimeloyl-ACP methyl ester carboxylesterase